MKTLKEIEKMLEEVLTTSRFQHTLGVMYTSGALAMKYNVDLDKAMLAGLLHDCAKCLSIDEQKQLCRENGISLSESEEKNPALIHAKLGSYLAKTKYEVTDEDVLNAIAYHTTGRPNMTILEEILYVADYIEPARHHAENLPFVRRLAFENIEQCMLQISGDILHYLQNNQNSIIDVLTKDTYEFYKNQLGLEEK
ncbi:bis(5'-nucleosyl)-tetraphosphatase (symmetrical) YqeK [Faecalimonas canis]